MNNKKTYTIQKTSKGIKFMSLISSLWIIISIIGMLASMHKSMYLVSLVMALILYALTRLAKWWYHE